MIKARVRWESWTITGILGLAFFVLSIDAQSVGLQNRTVVVFVLIASLALMVGFPSRHLRRNPTAWLLIASAGWVAAVAPLGLVPANNLAMGLSGLSLVMVSQTLVERVTFDRLLSACLVGLSSAVFLSLVSGGRADNGRVEGLFSGANALGARGAIIVVLGFAAWVSNRSIINLVPLGLGLMALVASDGRVNVAVASLGLLLVIKTALPRFVPWLWAAMVLVFAGLSATGSLGQSTVNLVTRSGTGAELTSFTGRTGVWSATLDGLRTFPLNGVGHAGGPIWYESIADTELGGFNPFEAHNAVLQVAVNGGIPAAILLALATVSYTVLAHRHPFTIRDTVVAMIVVLGLTESLFRVPNDIWLLFALCLAHAGSREAASLRPQPSAVSAQQQAWTEPRFVS